MAFGFLVDNNEFKVVEISYCWPTEGSESYSGYWDSDLNWNEKEITSEIFMLDDFIEEVKRTI